jgi:hypothetical protein
MATNQVVIPIAQAASASPKGISSGACSTGAVSAPGASCASASTCSSGSSCSSGGGVAPDLNDPATRLALEGWVLRTTIGEPRLSEVVENYRAMGFEVHVEHFGTTSADSKADDGEACTTCFDAADKSNPSQAWGSVYVRQGQPVSLNNELY